MALVGLERLLPARVAVDPRLRDRALGPGRVRGTAVELITAVRASPLEADPIVRERLRAARYLHSAERRLVSDGVYAWIRHGAWLAAQAGTEDAGAVWDLWVSVACGDVSEGPIAVGDEDPAVTLARYGNVPVEVAGLLISEMSDPVGFLAASNARAPLGLRVNRRRATREALAERLGADGVATRPSELAPDALIAERAFDVHANAAWRDGWFEVQDVGSQMVVVHGAPQGATLDACAGAGGKALHLVSVGAGPALALDVRPRALEELRRRAARSGARIQTRVVPPVGDWGLSGGFDTVLVDAPCTGSGTLRRHPELRFRLGRAHLDEQVALQRRLVAQAASHVRPGGRLVYATCSVFREECEGVVDAFLANEPRWKRDKPDLRVGPDTHDCDGIYVAALSG